MTRAHIGALALFALAAVSTVTLAVKALPAQHRLMA